MANEHFKTRSKSLFYLLKLNGALKYILTRQGSGKKYEVLTIFSLKSSRSPNLTVNLFLTSNINH